MHGFLYILKSDKLDRYYIGASENPTERVVGHNRGNTKSTKSGIPWELIFTQEFENINIAKKFERKLKLMKSRKLLETIIKNDALTIKL